MAMTKNQSCSSYKRLISAAESIDWVFVMGASIKRKFQKNTKNDEFSL